MKRSYSTVQARLTGPRLPSPAEALLEPIYLDGTDKPKPPPESPAAADVQRDDPTEKDASLHPTRCKRGRILPSPSPSQSAPKHPDELMTEREVRAKLRRVLSHLPRGSKKPLARLCGYRGKWALHTMRGVSQGRAMLPEAVRIRLSRRINQLFRGDLILIKTGMLTSAARPSHAWRHHQSLSARLKGVPIRL